MVCDVPLLRSGPSLGEVLHENQYNPHFDPQLLGSCVLINSIARRGFPYALASYLGLLKLWEEKAWYTLFAHARNYTGIIK